MVRACSYEVGGDVTNPRLAGLIERAKAASVPKVARFLTAVDALLSQLRWCNFTRFGCSRSLNAP